MAPTARANPRFALEAAIEIHGDDNRDGGSAACGRTANLSRGGFCATVDKPVASGCTSDISISLVFAEDSFSEPLAIRARIVWSTSLGPTRHQLGGSFVNVSDEQSQYLEMFLRFLSEGMLAADENDNTEEPPIDEDPFA